MMINWHNNAKQNILEFYTCHILWKNISKFNPFLEKLFLRSQHSLSFCKSDQVNANSTFEKEYKVTPLLANNKDKFGLALDGKLKDEDTNLASSTMLVNYYFL